MSYASVTSTKALKWFISGLFLLKLQFCTQKLGTFCTKNPKNNKRPPFYLVPKSKHIYIKNKNRWRLESRLGCCLIILFHVVVYSNSQNKRGGDVYLFWDFWCKKYPIFWYKMVVLRENIYFYTI